jgi:PST family polysaccharide transporter
MSLSINNERKILKSTTLMAFASAAVAVGGALRLKLVAIETGANGVGEFGIYQALMQFGALIASLGLTQAGTRYISAISSHEERLVAAKEVLSAGLLLALVSFLPFFVLAPITVEFFFSSFAKQHHISFGILSFGASLAVLYAGITPVLLGNARTADHAKVQVIASLAAVLGTVLFFKMNPNLAVIAAVVLSPLASCLFGLFYCLRVFQRKSVYLTNGSTKFSLIFSFFRPKGDFRLISGIWIMVGMVLSQGLFLVGRGLIESRLGLAHLGYFQASWMVSMTYISFVLSAMLTDFFPRITELLSQKQAANSYINSQLKVALILAAPALIGLATWSPVVFNMLYSYEFQPASELFRIQVLSDGFKVLSWPLAIVLLAANRTFLYLLVETVPVLLFLIGLELMLPIYGLKSSGYAFGLLYSVYFLWTYSLSRKIVDFRLSEEVKKLFGLLFGCLVVLVAIAQVNEVACRIFGTLMCVGWGFFACRFYLSRVRGL